MNAFQEAGDLLVTTLLSLYTYVLILRFVLQYLRVNYYNPFTQFVVKATGVIVVPVRRFVPGWRGIDFATLIVIFSITLLKLFLSFLMLQKSAPFFPGLLVWCVGDLLKMTVNLYFFAILVMVIASWIAPMSQSPIMEIIYRLTTPIMRPFKRIIPPLGGMDITPIFAILALQMVNIIITRPIISIGVQLSIMS